MSPDGSKIVFGSPRDGKGDIYVMNSDGSNWLRLTDTLAYAGEPKFSPDGSKIVFVSERDDNATGEIYLMNADGSNQTRLIHNEYYDSSPSFSPDGLKIVFTRLFGLYNTEIFVMNADGSDQKRLTNSRLGEGYPSFSPDGKKIRYTILNDNDRVEIWMMNADGSQLVRLMEMPEKATMPAFSPRGRMIVFLSSATTNYEIDPYTRIEIYTMEADGSKAKQLTQTKTYKSSPIFTPDGSKIIFLEEEQEGRGKGQIRIMNIDGTGLRTISNNY